jgi:hypothetical protein
VELLSPILGFFVHSQRFAAQSQQNQISIKTLSLLAAPWCLAKQPGKLNNQESAAKN